MALASVSGATTMTSPSRSSALGQGMNPRRMNAVVVGDQNPSHVPFSVTGRHLTHLKHAR